MAARKDSSNGGGFSESDLDTPKSSPTIVVTDKQRRIGARLCHLSAFLTRTLETSEQQSTPPEYP